MAVTEKEKRAIEDVMDALLSVTSGRRNLATMFRSLPDGDAWKEYYKIIPEPRSLDGIKEGLDKGEFSSSLDVFSDLNLVFSNALYFNEDTSIISKDAKTLQDLLKKTWEASPVLPRPPPDETNTPDVEMKPYSERVSTTKSSTQKKSVRNAEGQKAERRERKSARTVNTHPQSNQETWPGPGALSSNQPLPPYRAPKKVEDRSVLAAAGGMNALGVNPTIQSLPEETTMLFDRDPNTNQQLWFSGPPTHHSRNIVSSPRHSLEYLAFLAAKKQAATEGTP